jgi:hypothetical protein
VLLFLTAAFGVMTWRRTLARRSFILGLFALVALITAFAGNHILGLGLAAGILILGIGCVALAQLRGTRRLRVPQGERSSKVMVDHLEVGPT